MGDLEKVGDRDDGVHARVQAEFAARLAGHIADRHEQRRAVEHRFGRQHPVVCRVRRTEERKLRERRVRFTDIDEPVFPRVPHLLELLETPELPGARQERRARGRHSGADDEFGDQRLTPRERSVERRDVGDYQGEQG